MNIYLNIDGEPRPKGRPRFTIKGRAYTPAETRVEEQRIRNAFLEKYSGTQPYTEPLMVYIDFYMAKRGRPDLDNLIKLVTDALNGKAYVDDAQITCFVARKRYPDELITDPTTGRKRKRKSKDPYSYDGIVQKPHTEIYIKPDPSEGEIPWNPYNAK